MQWFKLLIVLIWCHFLADFGLQSNTMAKRKNWRNEKNIKENLAKDYPKTKYKPTWFYFLISHGFIHGACIYLFTGLIWIALVESILHIIIDFLKTSGWTNLHVDQFLHLVCKVGYVLI